MSDDYKALCDLLEIHAAETLATAEERGSLEYDGYFACTSEYAYHLGFVEAKRAIEALVAERDAMLKWKEDSVAVTDNEDEDDQYCTCPIEHDDNEQGFNKCSACGNRIDGSP